MKTTCDPTGVMWCLLHRSDTKRAADVAALCQNVAIIERHSDSGDKAQAAADAICAFLASRVPSDETPGDGQKSLLED